jgi:hypothetical protein
VTKRGTNGSPPGRPELEQLMSADMRAVTAQSDRIGRHFARQNDVSGNDFHALLHVMVTEAAGTPLTGSATAADGRLAGGDHLPRRSHDRCRSCPARIGPLGSTQGPSPIRSKRHGAGKRIFNPLGAHLRAALAGLPDRDLLAAHRVFGAMITAMSTFEAEIANHQSKPSTAPANAPSNLS